MFYIHIEEFLPNRSSIAHFHVSLLCMQVCIMLTELPEELGHAAAAHRKGVVDGRLDHLPVSRPQGDGPLYEQSCRQVTEWEKIRNVHTSKHTRFNRSMTAQTQELQVNVCVCAHPEEGLAAMLHTACHAIHWLLSAICFKAWNTRAASFLDLQHTAGPCKISLHSNNTDYQAFFLSFFFSFSNIKVNCNAE